MPLPMVSPHACTYPMRTLRMPHILHPNASTPPLVCVPCSTKAPPGSSPGLKLEVSLAMLADSTMAVEVAISEALLNWPYFQDLSLVGPRGACLPHISSR